MTWAAHVGMLSGFDRDLNYVPGLERSDNPGIRDEYLINPERVSLAQA